MLVSPILALHGFCYLCIASVKNIRTLPEAMSPCVVKKQPDGSDRTGTDRPLSAGSAMQPRGRNPMTALASDL